MVKSARSALPIGHATANCALQDLPEGHNTMKSPGFQVNDRFQRPWVRRGPRGGADIPVVDDPGELARRRAGRVAMVD